MAEVALVNKYLLALGIGGILAAIAVAILLVRNRALAKVLRKEHMAKENLIDPIPDTHTTHSEVQQTELVEGLVLFMEQNKPYLESRSTVERLAYKFLV